MKLESDREFLNDGIEAAFEAALLDTLDDAKRVAAQSSRTGKFERSLEASAVDETTDRLEARIGSALSSARAKERGAFIQAKRAPYLTFRTPDGAWHRVREVRLPPRPVVSVAGRRFPRYMTDRLREIFA